MPFFCALVVTASSPGLGIRRARTKALFAQIPACGQSLSGHGHRCIEAPSPVARSRRPAL